MAADIQDNPAVLDQALRAVQARRYSGSHRLLGIFKQRCAFSDNNHYIAPNFDMQFRWHQMP
ncbi:MAG TPA: hypothetical protein VFT23_08315 [Burkholderiales bacterium]|nr:hypothetical protein [Burkholderiales bacterium]